jgi:uncharacterized membrane protein YfcA
VEISPTTIVLLSGIFLLAGGVKGLIGVGLPTVALVLLVNFFPLRDGAALLALPAILTNIWQASSGGRGLLVLKRFWLLLVTLSLATWVGVGLLVASNEHLISGMFGTMIAFYAILGLTRRPASRPLHRSEWWLSPLVGIVNGLLNGLTGSYVFPGVLYLEALQLGRDEMIQAMGILFLVASAALAVALTGHSVMSIKLFALSAGATLPALTGYYAGQYWRRRIPEALFRRVFLFGLLGLGAYTALSNFLR